MNLKIRPPIGVRYFEDHGATPKCPFFAFLTLTMDFLYQNPDLGGQGQENSNLLTKKILVNISINPGMVPAGTQPAPKL